MGNFINLKGKTFGRLTVIERVEKQLDVKTRGRTYWLCRCDCGKDSIVRGDHLRKGYIQSCGCYQKDIVSKTERKNFIDLTGKKIGRLTIIKRAEKPKHIKIPMVFWLCKCDCGKEIIISRSNLRSGHTQSCGCYRRDVNSLERGEACRKKIFYTYRNDAKRRNLIFDLSEKEFFEIIIKNCFYCGEEPSNINKSRSNNGDFVYNGIDRIDSKKGYIKDNVVPCCWKCNHAKGEMNNFLEWVEKIYNYKILPLKIKGT